MKAMINKKSASSLSQVSNYELDAYDKFTMDLLEKSLQSFKTQDKKLLKQQQFKMMSNFQQESFDRGATSTLQSSRCVDRQKSNQDWPNPKSGFQISERQSALLSRRVSTRDPQNRTFDQILTKRKTYFRNQTPLATKDTTRQLSPISILATSNLGNEQIERKARTKRHLLAKIIQADKNIHLKPNSEPQSAVIGQNSQKLEQPIWKARKSVNPTDEKLVKSDFTTQTKKQLPIRTLGGTLTEPVSCQVDVQEAAIRAIKSHKKRQSLKFKMGTANVECKRGDLTFRSSVGVQELQLKHRSNTAEDKDQSRIKLDDSKRAITFDSRDQDEGSSSAYQRPWKINIDKKKVRKVSIEQFKTSAQSKKIIDSRKSHLSKRRGPDIKSRRESILADLKQTLASCLKPDGNSSDGEQEKPSLDFQSPRFNNETSTTAKPASNSILTNASTNRQQRQATKVQQDNRNASSLSPSSQRRQTANDSSLFENSKSRFHNESTTSNSAVVNFLQKAALPASNSVEIPKLPLQYTAKREFQNVTAMTEQSMQNMQSNQDENDSFRITLGREKLQEMTQFAGAAGDQLLINENFSQGVASSASSAEQKIQQVMQTRGRATFTQVQPQNSQALQMQDEVRIATNSSQGNNTDDARDQQISPGPPILTELPMFESIFSMNKSFDDDTEHDTPYLIHELGENSFTRRATTSFQYPYGSTSQNRANRLPLADDYDPQSKTQFLPFTRRHRSTLKGQAKVPTEFLFLKDSGQAEHQMRIKCSENAKSHREDMKEIIANLNAKVKAKLDFLHSKEVEKQIELDTGPSLPLRTKFDLESTLYYRFDIHKKDRPKQPRDQSWEYKLDDFLEKEKIQGQHRRLQLDLKSESYNSEREKLKQEIPEYNKAGNVQNQDVMIHQIQRLQDAQNQLTAFSEPVCHESELPIQVLYNQKIERIRVLEYEKHSPPLPIKFDISESYTGIEGQKMIKIMSDSAPKAYVFDIDLANKNNQRLFETQLGQFSRTKKFRKEVRVQLTDYTRGAKDNAGVAQFIKDIHNKVMEQSHERTFQKKLYAKKKTQEEVHDKFTRKVVGLRRGKQFDFVKIDRPEYQDKNIKKPTPMLFLDATSSVNKNSKLNKQKQQQQSSDSFDSEVSSVASLNSQNQINTRGSKSPLNSTIKKPGTSQDRSRTHRNLLTASPKKKKENDNLSMKSHSDNDKSEQTQSPSQIRFGPGKQLSFQLKRGKALKTNGTISNAETITNGGMTDTSQPNFKELTIAKDYESRYEKLQQERQKRLQQTKLVSKYEGVIPVHQRLILLLEDFLESTRGDFDINDLYNFQTVLQGLETSMNPEKADRLKRLIKELFKKYQIEIIQPNLDFILNKFQTSFEKLQEAEALKDQSKQGSQFVKKPLSKELIQFKYATYDNREPSPAQKRSPLSKRLATQPFANTGHTFETQASLVANKRKTLAFAQTKQFGQKKQSSFIHQISLINDESQSLFEQDMSTIKSRSRNFGQNQTSKIRSQTTYFAKKRLTGGTQLVDDDESEHSVLDTERQAKLLAEKEALKDEGKWFEQLNWQDNEKLQNFGHDRTINHTVALADLKPLSIDHKTPIIVRSRNARKSTVLGSLVEDSYRTFEKDFDQSELRQQIILQKSMFKRDIRTKDVFQNPNWLKNVISGASQEVIDESLANNISNLRS